MSDRMIPTPFEQLLKSSLKEHQNFETIFGVSVCKDRTPIAIGPAAGPHTQLCQNIVAAYIAGATCFEFKTVQILDGALLKIDKPCIHVANEVYNTEWSTELSVEQAKEEYIKAYLLIWILSRELQFLDFEQLSFIQSVGYDLKGIQSEKIDTFLNDLKEAKDTKIWKDSIAVLEQNVDLFHQIKLIDIEALRKASSISNTVTLSTMHGCKKEEIELIAKYLLEEKKMNTFIKLNPTLIGKERVQEILIKKGYDNLSFDEADFYADISMEEAVTMLRKLKEVAANLTLEFGVKLTNTFPVFIKKKELPGDKMYTSGPPLFALAIATANELAKAFDGDLRISYSGGANADNIFDIIRTNISPITVSSYLLKPNGYDNITKMKQAVLKEESMSEYVKTKNTKKIDLQALEELEVFSYCDENTSQKEVRKYKRNDNYHALCATCTNCVSVCPNRANVRVTYQGKAYVLHQEDLCNECGCCSFSCLLGHDPYREKFTVFQTKSEFETSQNIGAYIDGEALIFKEDPQIFDRLSKEDLTTLIQKAKEMGKV